MPMHGRFMPNEAGRRKISLRATVIQHLETKKGRWIFATTVYGIRVRYFDHQYQEFADTIQKLPVNETGECFIRPPQEVTINLSSKATRDKFALNSTIGITYGYSGLIDQFFTGTTPMALLAVIPEPKELLDGEIRPLQEPLFT